MPYTASRDIPYDNDAAAIFDGLAQSHDSLLLESADIETKKSLNCLAILRAALKVTCHGHRVEAQVLTKAGETLLPRYLVSVPDNGDSRWSRYGLPAL